MEIKGYDFSGWATKNDLRCSDGRIIRKDAFKGNDGQQVPLVFAHQHNDTKNVLGHAILENREEGVYAYGFLNDTESGKEAKELVRHGDLKSLSIYANNLKELAQEVVHGVIREVSLVLAGANPGAFIDSVMIHGEEDSCALIIGYDEVIDLQHSDDVTKGETITGDTVDKTIEHAAKGDTKEAAKGDTKEAPKGDTKDAPKGDTKDAPKEDDQGPTIQEIIDTMTEEQQNACYALVGLALDDAANNGDTSTTHNNIIEGENAMKHNLFENDTTKDEKPVITHEQMDVVLKDAKRSGSLKESFLAHADEGGYGITNVDYLFPDARTINTTPDFISRNMGWVPQVMNSFHKTPFSRIKSIFADITEDEARALGYIKGNLKKEEVFTLLKRTTTPTTIYKKQKMDRDDIIDITDFDVVAWLKVEMRGMLDEEIARAALIGDGRLSSSDDKISETCVRPIWKDETLYSVNSVITIAVADTEDSIAKKFIRQALKSRKSYKGSGNPSLYTTEDIVTDCLLIEDSTGRRIYNSVADLATALRVSEIVTVEPMENQTRTVDAKVRTLMGIIVNLNDYNVGADKGGAVNMFDDFDIDYNQQKYLIETRCSGALVKPYSAIVIESTPEVAG